MPTNLHGIHKDVQDSDIMYAFGPWRFCQEKITPGMEIQEFLEIVKQLIGRQIVNPAIEVVPDTSDCPEIGLKVLKMQTIKLHKFHIQWIEKSVRPLMSVTMLRKRGACYDKK